MSKRHYTAEIVTILLLIAADLALWIVTSIDQNCPIKMIADLFGSDSVICILDGSPIYEKHIYCGWNPDYIKWLGFLNVAGAFVLWLFHYNTIVINKSVTRTVAMVLMGLCIAVSIAGFIQLNKWGCNTKWSDHEIIRSVIPHYVLLVLNIIATFWMSIRAVSDTTKADIVAGLLVTAT